MINITIICYSPTNGGLSLANQVKMNHAFKTVIDITKNAIFNDIISINKILELTDILFLFVPVYAQSIPKRIKSFLKNLKYDGYFCPCVVYGSISSGKSLNDIMNRIGPKIIGAGEFISHHSYDFSNKSRPNDDDYALIKKLCLVIEHRYLKKEIIELPKQKRNIFSHITKHFDKLNASLPSINKSLCQSCDQCVKSCPLNIIDSNKNLINKKQCTRCYSCVHKCAYNAIDKKISGIANQYLKKHINYSRQSKIY